MILGVIAKLLAGILKCGDHNISSILGAVRLKCVPRFMFCNSCTWRLDVLISNDIGRNIISVV